MELTKKHCLLLVFLVFSIVHGNDDVCPLSVCGKGEGRVDVDYPFKLQNQTTANNCTYFNLTCDSSLGKTILNFPKSGYFYVGNIDYDEGDIKIYDPGNCLVQRLMNHNLHLEDSRFKAKYNENYTFYVCPRDSEAVRSFVTPIGCLGNSTVNMTVAFRNISRDVMEGFGCMSNGSWILPSSLPGQFENDESYLSLAWNANVCHVCEVKRGKGREKPMSKILAIALSLPALIIMAFSCFSVFCMHLVRIIEHKFEDNNPITGGLAPIPTVTLQTITGPSGNTNLGLNEAQIMACTEIIVLHEGLSIENGNCNTCSICLESYCDKEEKMRLIKKCGHWFHAICIEQWLGKNSTCPVCRTCLCEVVASSTYGIGDNNNNNESIGHS